MNVALRLVRYRSAWETASADELVRLLFCRKDGVPDCSLSVYLVTQTQTDQASAEHLASLTGPPIAAGCVDLNMDGLHEATRCPGDTEFKLTRDDAHAELRVERPEVLLEFARQLLAQPNRRIPRQPGALVAFMRAQYKEHDVEWTRLLARPDKSKWLKLVEKYRSTPT